MTENEKKEIIAYLSGPRDYREGVALYNRYGSNLMYKRRFALDETEATKTIMVDALRRLAGLSEAEFLKLPRLAKTDTARSIDTGKAVPQFAKAVLPKAQDDESALEDLADSFGVTVDELVSPDFQDCVLAMDENAERVEELTAELEEARRRYAVAPEPVRKMIRFREKFTFLNDPECPDVLKVLVADMFTAYGNYKTAFAHLQAIPDETIAEAAAECETIVNNYLANREIWDELEHYKATGEILGKAAKFRELEAAEDLAAIPDVDLMKKLDSARVNVSKNKKALAELQAAGGDTEKIAARLRSWTDRKSELEAEVERRKKK